MTMLRSRSFGHQTSHPLHQQCWRWGVVITAALLLQACGTVSGPSEDEVSGAIRADISGPYDVSVNAMEPFIDKDSGQGQVSVSGNLVAASDRYVKLGKTEVSEQFGNLGIPSDHVAFIRGLEPDPVFIRRVVSKGDTYPFQAELQVRKSVNGWEFANDGSVSRAAHIQSEGGDRGEFPVDAVVVGDKAPYFDKVKAISAEISRADAKVRTSFQQVVASGKPIQLRFWRKEDKSRAVYNREPFTLTLTAQQPVTTIPAKNGIPEQVIVEGPVTFKGTPSSTSGRFNTGTNEFVPTEQVRITAEFTRSGRPGSIVSKYNLRIELFDLGRFWPFGSSSAYFADGRISTYDQDSFYNWRWEQQ